MTPVDLLLIEGFKTHPHPKIEIHRASEGEPLLGAGGPGHRRAWPATCRCPAWGSPAWT